MDMEARYMIIRFHKTKNSRIIKRNLTLDEAQAHCRREDTQGKEWFDGYDLDKANCKG